MKKVLYRNQLSKFLGINLIAIMLFSVSLFSQSENADPAKGKQIFNQNCASCHSLDRKGTGPALRNVESRLTDDEGLDREWIYAWVKNSAGVIKSGDSYANKIFAEYNNTAMTPFPTLSNEDIDNILAYTAAKEEKPAASAVVPTTGEGSSDSSGVSNEVILGALALVFALLVAMLFMVNMTLRNIAKANGIDVEREKAEKRIPIWKAFVKNQF